METDLAKYVSRAEKAELEIQKLVKELESVEAQYANRSAKPCVGGQLGKLDSQNHEQGKWQLYYHSDKIKSWTRDIKRELYSAGKQSIYLCFI